MEAKVTLAQYAQELDPLLAEFFQNAEYAMARLAPESAQAVGLLGEYTMRKAKRIRSALIYYTYLMLGGKDLEAVRRASIFIELVHGYLLIHDDVMDEDSLRRGKPTMHKIYQDLYSSQFGGTKDAYHFGESIAINIGDIACHMAFELLALSDFPAEAKMRATAYAHRQLYLTGHGQMHDIFTSIKKHVADEDVFFVHQHKTAVYTYETPISVGALLAGASETDVATLSRYAIPAGIAFQIQDDILGMFGDEEKLGKPTISDLREGKQTLLIIHALEKASAAEKKVIKGALGNSKVSQKTADVVREIIISTGALDRSRALAQDFVTQAKDALATRPDWRGPGREFLDGIADYIIQREV